MIRNLLLALCLIAPLASRSQEWDAVRSRDVATVAPGWSTPSVVAKIASPGWEDGAYISSDGRTLYFIYIDIDVFRFPSVQKVGPDRDRDLCFLGCGTYPRADLYYIERLGDGSWSEPRVHPLSIKKPLGGFVLARPDKAYFMIQIDDAWKEDIGFAEKVGGSWNAPQRIQNVSSPVTDRDPWVGPDEQELWFTSERDAVYGEENIYRSQRIGAAWGDPEIMPPPLNSEKQDMQPFLHGGYVYFASDRNGPLAIYRSRQASGVWEQPEEVVRSTYGVGEPTLTADGLSLFFVQLFIDDGHYNMEVMQTTRSPGAPSAPILLR